METALSKYERTDCARLGLFLFTSSQSVKQKLGHLHSQDDVMHGKNTLGTVKYLW